MADTTHTVEQDITRIKEDIASLKTDTEKVKEDVSSLKTDMGRVKEDMISLKTDMTGVKAEMKYFATKADLEHMGRMLIMWNVSSIIALTGIVVAIVRLLR